MSGLPSHPPPANKRRARRGLLCLGAGLLFCGSTVSSLNAFSFQLHATTIEEDGFTKSVTYFQHDEQTRIFVQLPRNWKDDGGTSALTLTCPASTGSLIRLEMSGLSPDLPFAAKTLEMYRSRSLQTVPKGATDVSVAEEHPDPLPVFHWKSYEFVIEYAYFGETYRRSVVFVDLNSKEQMIVTTLAVKAAFQPVHDVSFDFVRSWQETAVR